VNRKWKKRSAVFIIFVMFLSLLLPVGPSQPVYAIDSEPTTADTNRSVRFTYIRDDQNFGDWNIWVWNTGATDGEINFQKKEGNQAVADIAIGPNATQMGFVLRSTHDWNTAQKEFGDRNIQINKNDNITKAFITSGVEEIRVVPDGSAPVIDNGKATFYYRDKILFANDAMHTVEKVELKFNGKNLPMTYEPENERFVITYENLPTGENEYSFLVTKNGVTTEVTDPYNTINGVSKVSFKKLDMTVTGSVTPAVIDYNENAVLSVDIQGENAKLSKLTADLTELGGPANFEIDPNLREISIAVDDDITTGTKTIPITAVDSFGNPAQGTATIEIKTRQMVGNDDFDWDESIIYFMLTDRFFDGDSSNNHHQTDVDRGAYQGGDFEGITAKLDYLKNLGVNTIWISPIVENVEFNVRNGQSPSYHAYHGYWANNFENLNPHFGTIEEFHSLIDGAHDRGMKIMVDVVLNHTGYGLKELDGNTENPPVGFPTNEDRSRFKDIVRQGNVGEDEVVGELSGLPDIRTEDPAVREQIIEWQTGWIDKARTNKGNTIDYFRVDTVKHVEDATWMAFKNELTKKLPSHKMIGEAWGADVNNDQGYLDSGMMDSVLDFGFKQVAKDFVNGKLVEANQSLEARNGAIDNTATLGQFLGSHDEDGFLYSLGGDRGKLKVAAALQATAKGQPVIYYGEELGLSGANNYPVYDNRYDFGWNMVEGNDILAHYQKIFTFRSAHSEVFAKGDRQFIGGKNADQYLLFSRNYQDESVYVGLNVGDAAKQVTLAVDSAEAFITDSYSDKEYQVVDGKATITIPAKADGGTVLFTLENGSITGVVDGNETPANTLRIHYNRTDQNYTNFGLWLWGDVVTSSTNWPTGGTRFEKFDHYGAYVDVPMNAGAAKIGFVVINVTNGDKDGGDKNFTIPSGTKEIWIKKGSDEVFTTEPEITNPVTTIPKDTIRIHYQRTDNNYQNQGLWLWNDVAVPSANWPSGGTRFEKFDSYGAYLDVPLKQGAQNIGFLVLDVTSGNKDSGDKSFTIASPEMNEIWIKQGSDEVFTYEPVNLPANTVRIHYVRSDQNYQNLGLWNWGDVRAPSTGWPTGAADFTQFDRYGAYVDLPLNENAKNLGMLVVNKQTGAKDGEQDKSFNLLDKYKHLWIRQGESTVYISPYWGVATGLVSAEVVSDQKIRLGFTMTDGLTADSLRDMLVIKDANGGQVSISSVTIKDAKTVEVTAVLDLTKLPLTVTYSDRTVTAATSWRMLDEMYYYDGDDLGASYQDGDVTLKLWAPKASSVVANFFNKNNAAEKIGSIPLVREEKGVWTADVKASDLQVADLEGYYYQYEVTNDGVTKTVLDPYAKSMAAFTVNTKGEAGADGDVVGKAAIVGLDDTDPAGFDHANINGYEKREDAIIYEVHVRDFTSDPSIGDDLTARWGSYKAFIDKLHYIKSLGVTHVQLLPVMAWYYGDETMMGERELDYSAQNNEYNWGYDPHSYFSPDGAYSEDPRDAELRVKELKMMIDAIHEAGMGVVLDVVYTHMAKASMLDDIVPGYYSFLDANGNPLGGFGNNLATSHKMAEKLMVDSVKYWFDEYKIDGMRFDMMGDATYPSIQNAYDAAAEINPNALFIGEGWRTFAGHISDPDLAGMGADQDWMNKTDNVGVFSDEIRNELKSGFGSEGEPRFITGGARNIGVIFNNIKGQPGNTPADDPGDMVQYIEAHDNMTLYDVIAQSIKKNPAVADNNLEIHKRIRLGNSLILTSQGTAFLHAGQEYGRTKQWLGEGVPEQKYHELWDATGKSFGYFIHDSYDSSDAINMFDWQKATDSEEYEVNNVTREFTAGLIQLRKSTNAFRLGEKALVNQNVRLLDFSEIQATDSLIAYESVSTDDTGVYYVFMNADDEKRSLSLAGYNFRGGDVIVDSDEAGVLEVSDATGFVLSEDKLTIDPLTTIVIKMKRKADEDPVAEEVVAFAAEDFMTGEISAVEAANRFIDVAVVGEITPAEIKELVLAVAHTGEVSIFTKASVSITGQDRAILAAGEQIERSLTKMLEEMKKNPSVAEKNAQKQVVESLIKIKKMIKK
jgi:secreted pullulanase